MTAITPTPGATASSGAALSRAELSKDFDTFLQLLTTQLQNQDPLKPMDPTEFVSQLTQFSELEQAVEQSGSLEDIKALLGAQSSFSEVALLGQEVEALTQSVTKAGGPVTVGVQMTQPTNGAVVEIVNPAGNVVATLPVASGATSVEWDGRKTAGGMAADGTYGVRVVAGPTDDRVEVGNAVLRGTVSEIRMNGNGTELLLASGQNVSLEGILSVR